MRTSFRQTIFAATTILGLPLLTLGAFSAAATAAGVGDPTVVHPQAGSGQAASPGRPDAGHNAGANIERRIADLHAKLEITPAQQAEWDLFAQVMRDNARSIDETFQQREKALPGLNAAENIESYSQLATEHSREVQKLVPAFQALYDKMTDTQKHHADQVFRTDANHGEPGRHAEQARHG
jgi:uncharacterized coiled-coil protein SlyX